MSHIQHGYAQEKTTMFLNWLLDLLQKSWNTVSEILKVAFGYIQTLHVIFYRSSASNETMMEIWDPKHVYDQPSRVFKLRHAPQSSPLPPCRSEAQVLILEDWYH